MNGIVYSMNPQRGMVAIATAGDGFTIIELTGDDEIEPGDLIEWKNATGLGGETYFNKTKGKSMNVIVQNHSVALDQLREQLLFRS